MTAKCPLLDRIPKVKSSGNMVIDNKASAARQNLVDCIQILWDHPQARSDCATFLRGYIDNKAAEDAVGDDAFAELSTFGRLEEAWLASWLSNKLGISGGVLGKAKLEDPHIVRELAQSLVNMTTSAKLPQQLRNNVLCRKFLDRRYADMGERGRLMAGKDGVLNASGKVNWLKGVYALEFSAEGQSTHVMHRPHWVQG